MANFTPASNRKRLTFSADPAEGRTSSSMSACGATNDAISRPIWIYVPRVDAVTILNSAAASATVTWSGNPAATSAATRIFFISSPHWLSHAGCRALTLRPRPYRTAAALDRPPSRHPDDCPSEPVPPARRHPGNCRLIPSIPMEWRQNAGPASGELYREIASRLPWRQVLSLPPDRPASRTSPREPFAYRSWRSVTMTLQRPSGRKHSFHLRSDAYRSYVFC